jgi:cobalt-zinc-cadmium efflux system protein
MNGLAESETPLRTRNEKRLLWAIAVTFVVLLGEVIGGLISNSLALLSDAGHVLTDVFALGLSLVAVYIGKRPSDYRATYGYQRIGILAALINGMSLVVISVFIFFETYRRIFSPPEINSNVMLFVAAAGLIGNIVMAKILGAGHTDLNIKSAWLHVLGDMVTSAGVIVAGLIIRFSGWYLADPIASAIVGVIIIYGGGRVIKEALWVFLELSPMGFHAEDISKTICGMENVLGVHDVHVWSIGHGVPAFSAHVLCSDRLISETDGLRVEIEDRLAHLGFKHTVLQMECAECQTNALYCQVPGAEDVHHHHH